MKRLAQASKKKFVRDAVTLQAASLVQMATYFITSVLTANYLGALDYGRWAAAREIFAIAYFLVSMGVVNATMTVYSEAVGRQDRQRGVEALAALLKIGVCTAALLTGLGVTLAPWLSGRFYGDEAVGSLAAILCFAGFGEVARGFATAALQGTRQMLRYTVFDITSNVARVGLIALVVVADLGLPGMAGAFLAHMLVSSTFAFVSYRHARFNANAKIAPPPLREVLAAVRTAPIRHIFGLSYLISLNKQMNTLVPRLGAVLIPSLAVATFADNGAYQVAHVLAGALTMGLSGVAQTLLPTLGFKLGQSDSSIEEMGGMLKRVSLATGGFMCAATLLSVPVVAWILATFYIDEYGDSFQYFLGLASGNLFIGFAVVVDSFYLYSGKIRQVVPVNLVFAALATLGIVLGSKLFGPIGTAWAAGLCRGFSLFHLLYIWIYFRRARARRGPATT